MTGTEREKACCKEEQKETELERKNMPKTREDTARTVELEA